PDAAIATDDPAVQFATGGRRVSFSFPANGTQPVPQLALQTGTVAGTIELSFSVEGVAVPDLDRTIKIPRSAPALRDLKLVRNANGFELRLTGFSTSREVTQADVRFNGTGLQTTQASIPLADLARTWYSSPASAPFGSQFSLILPFSVQ